MIDGPTRKQPDIKVTLLGTGGPELTRDRMGAATLIEAGGKPLPLDIQCILSLPLGKVLHISVPLIHL